MNKSHCHICGGQELKALDQYPFLNRVTSDCRPFRNGGQLVVCMRCGAIQTKIAEEYMQDISEIYSDYDIYHQADGEEQKIVDGDAFYHRSMVLVDYLDNNACLFSGMSVLDVGCGNGSFLRELSKRGDFQLDGFEIDSKENETLNTIPGFDTLYSNRIEDINKKYDLVVMIHSLEHFLAPVDILSSLGRLLNSGGRIFVQVPNVMENPFDLIIADHVMHFSPVSLGNIMALGGFSMDCISTSVAKREISALVSKNGMEKNKVELRVEDGVRYAEALLSWLMRLLDDVRDIVDRDNASDILVFGSSIAAVWIDSVFSHDIHCFIDEDASRHGKYLQGKKIISIPEIPECGMVIVALVPDIAKHIDNRLASLGVKTYVPPEYFVV